MALTRNVIFIAFVLLVLVSITTQKKNQRQCIKARCNRLLKNFKKLSCKPETPGTFLNVYYWSRHNKTLTCKRLFLKNTHYKKLEKNALRSLRYPDILKHDITRPIVACF